MELQFDFEITGNKKGNKLEIECNGVIDSYEGFKEFKARFFKIAETDALTHYKKKNFDELDIVFTESYPISFEIVGFLIKLKERDKIQINIMTYDVRILNFFISVYLDELLNVKLL